MFWMAIFASQTASMDQPDARIQNPRLDERIAHYEGMIQDLQNMQQLEQAHILRLQEAVQRREDEIGRLHALNKPLVAMRQERERLERERAAAARREARMERSSVSVRIQESLSAHVRKMEQEQKEKEERELKQKLALEEKLRMEREATDLAQTQEELRKLKQEREQLRKQREEDERHAKEDALAAKSKFEAAKREIEEMYAEANVGSDAHDEKNPEPDTGDLRHSKFAIDMLTYFGDFIEQDGVIGGKKGQDWYNLPLSEFGNDLNEGINADPSNACFTNHEGACAEEGFTQSMILHYDVNEDIWMIKNALSGKTILRNPSGHFLKGWVNVREDGTESPSNFKPWLRSKYIGQQ